MTKPRKILIVHNEYQHRGGEDSVVEAESQLLREHEQLVMVYRRKNSEIIGKTPLEIASDTLWSRRTTEDLTAIFADFKPDVVHAHNTLPLVSPSLYWVANRANVPVVQTLHNFRLVCPQALLLRDGRICEECIGKVPWRAIQHKCYRGSTAQSAAVAIMVQAHRWAGTWSKKISLYIALNEFCRQKFIDGGIPSHKIRVKPNFIDMPGRPFESDRQGFLFVGRLSEEKGVKVLIETAPHLAPGLRIRVAGSGPSESEVQNLPHLILLGALNQTDVYREMSSASALILPSIWYENFPRTIVEAYALGLPVIASRLGAMASLIRDRETGLLFEPGDPKDLAAKVNWATQNPDLMREMGRRARLEYETNLTAETNILQLLAIYDEARGLATTEEPA